MQQLTPKQLHTWLTDSDRTRPVLLDVREPWEFTTCHIPGSLLMPMGTLPARYLELDRTADIVVICHHGGRSFQSGLFLENAGFGSIHNLQGGVAAWARDVDHSMPSY
jgi:rhodanese-related sulfurtransferase